ncbi:MAG: hypothetical protein ACLP7Q_10575 [Isosphaeraceae bacterium]
MAAMGVNRLSTVRVTEDSGLIGELPQEVGVLLIIAGLGGILLPGPVGTPFLLVGLVTLWPRLFARVEACFQCRFPGVHRRGTKQIKRFLTDLNRRYPLPE